MNRREARRSADDQAWLKTFTFGELRVMLTDAMVGAHGRSRVNPQLSKPDAISILYRAIEKREGAVVTTRDRLVARNILWECASTEASAEAARSLPLIPEE